MQKPRIKEFLTIVVMLINLSVSGLVCPENQIKPDSTKAVIIEDFDSGVVSLGPYPGEDEDPMDWGLDSETTYGNSPWSLKLFGNTWKLQNIDPVFVEAGDVWQISVYIDSVAEIQGFGIMDSINVLFYSFAGTEELDIEEWVPVYQGAFHENQWNDYQLPVADDWLALFDYLPKITDLVYINDNDDTLRGEVYFDQIMNISNDLASVPEVLIEYSIGGFYTNGEGNEVVDVEFFGEVVDPDSDEHDFFWDFGDGSTSQAQNPSHTFLVNDDHPYTVLLEVVDPTNLWGQASCSIEVDPGGSTFPVTINFVGDIMLARKYEYPGGIIPTQGVEAIFEPTKPYLGDAANITVANLESPLTTFLEQHPTKSICFKGSPDNVEGLTYAGIDIVTLANNHILDYMLPGMHETQYVLNENNLVYFGAGVNSYEAYLPAFYSKSGVVLAFLGASDRTGQYNNYQPYLNAGFNKPGFANLTEYYIEKQITEVKDVSDLVVMEWHSGTEYSLNPGGNIDETFLFAKDSKEEEGYSPLNYSPSLSDKEIRHFAIDNGADLVICHHPHIIHGVELYNGKLIAHSLGNFVFDLVYSETFPSMILNAKVDETGFYEFTITPIYIDDFIPQRAEGALGLHILDDLAQRSKDLDTYLKVDKQNVTASVIMDTMDLNTYDMGLIAELQLEQVNENWESAPFHLERKGSISSVDNIQPQGDYEFRLGRDKIFFGNMEDEGCTLWNLNNSSETYCDSVAFDGERSIQHIREPSSPFNIVTNFEKRIICRSDTLNYSLCGYMKTRNGADVTIEIRYFAHRVGGDTLGLENIGVFVNGDTPWAFYHKGLTIPAGTKFFNIRLNSHVPELGTAYSWFDNVSIVRWGEWGEYGISETIPFPNDFYFMQFRSAEDPGEITVDYSETAFSDFAVGIDNAVITTDPLCLLEQNFPNPFNPGKGQTNISFYLDKTERIRISIYNIVGQKLKLVTDAVYEAGKHTVSWDGTNNASEEVSSGIYFYQLETPSKQQIKKCMVVDY